MIQTIAEHLEKAVSALGFVAVATLIAWQLGFFRIPYRQEENEVTVVSTFGIFGLYFFVQMVLVPFFFYIGWFILNGEESLNFYGHVENKEIGWLSLAMMLSTTLFLLVYSLVLGPGIRKTVWNSGSHGFRGKVKSGIIGVLTWLITYPWVLIIGQLVAIVMVIYYGESPPETDQSIVKHLKDVFSDKTLFFMTIASVTIGIPISEELLFRGFFQNLLKKVTSVFWSVVISSVFFSFLHFSTGQGLANWHIVLALFVISCFLGYVYERQKNLWAPIALHITVNSVSTAILFL
ncbi:MAG: hypothetical protein K940chlam3_01367 [Chlamydiae bacterium]|nr:hypothetical protein [Chlamydiota bacterium]